MVSFVHLMTVDVCFDMRNLISAGQGTVIEQSVQTNTKQQLIMLLKMKKQIMKLMMIPFSTRKTSATSAKKTLLCKDDFLDHVGKKHFQGMLDAAEIQNSDF